VHKRLDPLSGTIAACTNIAVNDAGPYSHVRRVQIAGGLVFDRPVRVPLLTETPSTERDVRHAPDVVPPVPYTELPDDFREKHHSVWVDIHSSLFDSKAART